MKSTGLFAELKNHPWILTLVIIFHLCLAILLGMNLSSDEKHDMPVAQQHKIINAVVVDGKKIDTDKPIKKSIKKPEVKKVPPKKDKQKEEEKKKQIAIKEQEVQKKKELAKKQLEKKQQLEKEQLKKKKALELKKNELKKKKEQDLLKQEKAKKEKAEKEKAEKQRIKKELIKKEQARKKAQAEKKRKLDAERKHRAEEKAEFENALREEEMAEEAAARAAMLQTQRQKYVLLIAQKVENNWLRPVTNTEGESCDVIVTQTMTGDVLDVKLKSCNSDNAFQRSVQRAVRKASPLPMPPNPDVFDREIYFTFKPR